jgi:hypothetical protein
LTPHRQAAPMPQAPVAAYIHQSLDAHGYFTAQIAFYDVLADFSAQRIHLGLIQIPHLAIRGNLDRCANLLGSGRANAIDSLQRDDRVLIDRNVDACNTGHALKLLPSPAKCFVRAKKREFTWVSAAKSIRIVGLSLPLFMAGILANHPHYTVAADDFAIATNFLYRGAYFHCYSPDSIRQAPSQ